MTGKLFSKATAALLAATAALLALGICTCTALADEGDDADFEGGKTVAVDAAALSGDAGNAALAPSPLADDDIDSGTIGTCRWTIDAGGCLTIAPRNGQSGSFEVSNPSTSSWPWIWGTRDRRAIQTVKVESGVSASGSLAYMFYNCTNLTSVDLSGFETSHVTSMHSMFYDCSSLTSLDLSCLDTSSVTNMGYMVYNCYYLVSVDVSGLDTSSVTNMARMFSNCYRLASLDVSGLDTSSVTNMDEMFSGSWALTSLDLSGFDTSHVTNMYGVFYGCRALTSLDLSGFDTSNVTDMGYMIYNCPNLTSVDVSGLDTSSVTNMDCMFSLCSSLASLDMSGWDTSNVTSMTDMFYNCTGLRTVIVGENFTLASNLPTPRSNDTDGKWMSDDGTIYESPSDIPSGVAATYTAVFPTDAVAAALEELVGEAEALDPSDYTSGSRAVLESALSDARDVLGKEYVSQDEVDAAADALQSAIDGLVPAADKSALEALIGEASALDASDYTSSSWSALSEALAAARAADADGDASQGDVDAAAGALQSAIDGLVPAADKSALEALISEASSLDAGEYESRTWAVLAEALGAAEGVDADGDASQGDVDAAAGALTSAIDGLLPLFHDVTDPGLWYYDAVYGMAGMGYVTGHLDNGGVLIFDHGGTMDRAQMAEILWRMAGEPAPAGSHVFKDVDYSDYYGDAVDWAYEAGVITGYRDEAGDLIFDPSGALDFEALVTMAARAALGSEQAAETWPQTALDDPKFTDAAAISDWARGPMAWAIDEGMVTGSDNGDGTFTLDPGDHTARGRGVTVLWRAYEAGVITTG